MFSQESNAWVQEIIANIRSILISFQHQYRSLAQSSNSTPMTTPVHKPTTAGDASEQKIDVSQWILRLIVNNSLRHKHDEEKRT